MKKRPRRAAPIRTYSTIPHRNEAQEESRCVLCGSTHYRDYWKLDGYRFVRCRRCRHVYQNPRPTPPALGARYATAYFNYELENAEPFFQLMLRGIVDSGVMQSIDAPAPHTARRAPSPPSAASAPIAHPHAIPQPPSAAAAPIVHPHASPQPPSAASTSAAAASTHTAHRAPASSSPPSAASTHTARRAPASSSAASTSAASASTHTAHRAPSPPSAAAAPIAHPHAIPQPPSAAAASTHTAHRAPASSSPSQPPSAAAASTTPAPSPPSAASEHTAHRAPSPPSAASAPIAHPHAIPQPPSAAAAPIVHPHASPQPPSAASTSAAAASTHTTHRAPASPSPPSAASEHTAHRAPSPPSAAAAPIAHPHAIPQPPSAAAASTHTAHRAPASSSPSQPPSAAAASTTPAPSPPSAASTSAAAASTTPAPSPPSAASTSAAVAPITPAPSPPSAAAAAPTIPAPSPPPSAPRTFLDIGCATGRLLSHYQTQGWSVQGIELCHPAAEYGRTHRQVPILSADYRAVRLPDAHYRIVHSSHVIEHVTDPLHFLRFIARVMHPDGYALIVTPDIHSMQARLMGRRWRSAIADHLNLFSARHLIALAQQARLRLIRKCSWGGLAQGIAPLPIKRTLDIIAKGANIGDVMLLLLAHAS